MKKKLNYILNEIQYLILATLLKQQSAVLTILSFERVISWANLNQFFMKMDFAKEPSKRAKKSDITLRMLRNSQQIAIGMLPHKRSH